MNADEQIVANEFGGVSVWIDTESVGRNKVFVRSLNSGRVIMLDPVELEMLADCDRSELRALWKAHLAPSRSDSAE
jgi:hypothetical protein